MKKFAFKISAICTAALLCSELLAQTQGKAWTAIDWPARESTTGDRISQNKSGEDWWYDHENVFDANGNHIGYIASGFSQGVNRVDDYEIAEGGCYSCFPSDRDPNCAFFETPDNMKTCIRGLVFEYDLQGNMKWCRSYNSGELNSITQTSDRGFLSAGFTFSTRNVSNPNSWSSGVRGRSPNESGAPITELVYNPDGSRTHLFNGDCSNYELNDAITGKSETFSRPVLVKMDDEGKVEWNFQYGINDFDFDPSDPDNNGEDAIRFRTGPWADVVEHSGYYWLVASGTTRIEDASGDPVDGVSGAMLFKINLDGTLAGKSWLPILESPNVLGHLEIKTLEFDPGTNNLLIAGSFFPENGSHYEGYVGKINVVNFPSSSLVHWERRFNSGSYNNTITDLAIKPIVGNPNEIIVPVIRNCTGGCAYSGDNRAEGEVYILNSSNGTISSSNNVGKLNAFDIKFGVTTTSDGGYAVISSRGKYDNNGSLVPLLSGDPSIAPYLDVNCNDYDHDYWDTDAYVAKFDGSHNLVWDQTFDAHENSRQGFPGDLKKQECMYSITEDPGTGDLVISGNSSQNFDDCLMMKISDCQTSITDYFNGSDVPSGASGFFSFHSQSLNIRGKNHDEIRIENTTTWNASNMGDKKIRGVIRVMDGATLYVEDITLEFADPEASGQWSYILVDAGGKLVADNGAKFTSIQQCQKTSWSGIQVASDGTTKGIVELIGTESDPIIIENAEDGIRTGDVFNVSQNYWTSFGGEIDADYVNFTNNLRDVEIIKWELELSGHSFSARLLNYPASFDHCNFIKDQIFNKPRVGRGGSVTIWDAHNIIFTDCVWDFRGVDYEEQDVLAAIYTYDASFKVTGSVTEGTATSRFENCHYGVFSQKTWNYSSTIEVENSTFDLTKKGIFAYGSSGYQIINNKFIIPSLPRDNEDLIDAYGVFVSAPSTYTIKNNTFEGAAGSGFNTGFIGRNNWNNNAVRANAFSNLTVAAEANLENQDEKRFYGMQFLCDDFQGNIRDIYSTHRPLNSNLLSVQTAKTGISLNQGTDIKPTGNLFTNTPGLQENIDNSNVSNSVIYFYHDPNFGSNLARLDPTEIDYTAGSVSKIAISINLGEHCSSTGSGVFNKTDIEADLAYYDGEIVSMEAYLGGVLDDGDSEALLQLIEEADGSDVASIYGYIMSIAPYVSKASLEALALNENFTPAMVRNVLLVCTHAAKDPEYVELLNSRGDISPAYMDDITLAAQGTSDYENFNANLAYQYHGKYNAVEDLYLWHMQNIDLNTYGNLLALFGAQPTAYYQYRKAALQMQEGNLANAETTLLAMETMDLGAVSMRFHNDYKDWQQLLKAYVEFDFSDTNTFSLSDGDQTFLSDLLEAGDHPLNPAALAFNNQLREILQLDMGNISLTDAVISSIDPVHMPGVNYYKNEISKPTASKLISAMDDPLSIYPNPSSRYFTIEWLGAQNGEAQLLDIQGRVLQRINLTQGIGILNTAGHLPNGMYLIRVSSSEGEVRTQKVLLQH